MRIADDALPVGTKVQIKGTFERNGETGVTTAPDFHGVIHELGDLDESYTGLQSYIVKLVGIIPPGLNEYWWADATQFDVIED